MISKINIAVLFLLNIAHAQWITSTAAESSLFACPGFEPGIVTHSDGSSIVTGYLEDWIFAQKFDEKGYNIWPKYIAVHQNDSSDYCTKTRVFSDGNGGAIFVWQDARLQYKFGNNKGLQLIAQRIDYTSQKRWGSSGIVIAEDNRHLERYNIASLNTGDVIIIKEEADTGYFGASLLQKLIAVSIDEFGEINWSKTLDSNSSSVSLGYRYGAKYPDKILLRTNNLGNIYLKHDGSIDSIFSLIKYSFSRIDNDLSLFAFGAVSEEQRNDSLFQMYPVFKYDSHMNLLWQSKFEVFLDGDGFAGNGNADPFIVDESGGIYSIASRYKVPSKRFTRVAHIDSFGNNIWGINKVYIDDFDFMIGGRTPESGIALIHNGDARSAVRFDYNGNPLWPGQPITVFKDPFDNAYFTKCESDNNGGFVCVFWRTEGGIYVKHSGRTGTVGKITRVKGVRDEPMDYQLEQNYPNPFNSSTHFAFSVSQSGNITITIYDVLGKMIDVAYEGYLEKGKYSLNWSANSFSSGIYFYTLSSRNTTITKRMILIK